MEVLMPRFSRRRFSRTVVSATVIAVAIGAALQFHHLRSISATTPPPLQVSMNAPVAPSAVKESTPLKPKPDIQPAAFVMKPLVTQTPDPTRPEPAVSSQLLAMASSQQPVAVKPISTTPLATSATEAPRLTAAPSTLIAEAIAKQTAGDLLGARSLLNSALLSHSLSVADTDAVKKQLADINQIVVFSPKQFPKDPLGGVYTVKSGDRLASIGNAHSVPFELLLSLNRMTDARKLRYGQSLKVINGPFHAVVTKSKFTLDLYLGSPGGADSTYITTFAVGLGTDNSTPTGTWTIKNKVIHPAYFPPEGHPGPTLLPDDPKNPLGPCWMGLEGTDGQAVGQQSYGIHGTIDPSSIGKQSSMGCIRMKNEDAQSVYKMLMQSKSTVIVRD